MKYSAQRSEEPNVAALLKELVNDIPASIEDASREQKRKLLLALEGLLPGEESMLNSWLKDLVKSRDVSRFIEGTCEHEQRRLLMLLEDLRGGDRRRHPRKPCSIKVTVDNLYTELVRNISTGGVFIQTTVPFSVGRQVSLVFPFPSPEEPIRMTGEIVWKSALGVGVRFRSPSKRLKKAIASL